MLPWSTPNSNLNSYSTRMGRVFFRDYTVETNYEGIQAVVIPLLFLIIVFFIIRYCFNKKTLIFYTIIASTIYLIYFFWWLPLQQIAF